MNKPKVYLDTSVISHLEQDDAPDKMKDSHILWEEIKKGRYDVYVSETVIGEMMGASKEKRTLLAGHLQAIPHAILASNDAVEKYAAKLIEVGVLTQKSYNDCLHIAHAVVNRCDMILSWNFSHMVRVKTIDGVRYVSSILGYGKMGIYAPSMIVERGEVDGKADFKP